MHARGKGCVTKGEGVEMCYKRNFSEVGDILASWGHADHVHDHEEYEDDYIMIMTVVLILLTLVMVIVAMVIC